MWDQSIIIYDTELRILWTVKFLRFKSSQEDTDLHNHNACIRIVVKLNNTDSQISQIVIILLVG